MWMIILFWILAAVIFFTYAGYPILLYLLSFIKKKKSTVITGDLPSVTIVIAAYNEEVMMEKKLMNTFAQEYPVHLLQVIVIADGSTDATAAIASTFSNVLVLYEPQRKGKAAAINRAIAFAGNEIVVLTDANSFLQQGALKELIKPFADAEVGAVAGEKKVVDLPGVAASGEGIYWKYESWLKQQETVFYTVVGAAGELFALRKKYFISIPEHTITDDFFLSLSVNLQQKKCMYAKQAVSIEAASLSLSDEWKRKVRIAAGGIQSLFLVSAALNPARYPKLAFQFFSHRVLRWLFCAPAMIILFFMNWMIIEKDAAVLYELLFAMQLIFYGSGFIGWLMAINRKTFFMFSIPFYIVFMHAAMLAGIVRFANGKQSVLWEKAKR